MDTLYFSRHININRFTVNDPFWNRYTELIRNEVIPYQYDALNDNVEGAAKSNCIDNFKKACNAVKVIEENGELPVYPTDKWEYNDTNSNAASFHGWVFQDSDIYKWLEAVGFSLAAHPDRELEEKADRCIELICGAQLKNGYLDTLYIINDRSKVFTDLKDKHELYCFGHLAEAAVSYFNATGKRKLLDTACRFADLICQTFGPDGIKGYPGHEIAEMALVKLYDITHKKAYLNTAKFFIEQRGTKPYYFDEERNYKRQSADEAYHYNQAHKPPRAQTEAVGHAVRGVYLYSGMADIAKEYKDDELYSACKKLWNNLTKQKMYITGGIGSTVDGEAFSYNYDLPNDLAYSETCASIGLIFFARRMLEISPDAQYADVMERALYNTVLSGMALDGKSFFYVNPLEVLPEASKKDSRKWHIKPTRQKWFGCACCPPNIARLLSSLGEYCYTENSNTVFAHLFVAGKLTTDKADIEIVSDYHETGTVEYKINAKKPFTFAVRIPGWCDNYTVSTNHVIKNGYAFFDITENISLKLCFEIEPKLIKCSNKVRANIGKVAVMRGPVVYCMEAIDNGEDIHMLSIKKDTELKYKDGAVYADGYREKPDENLYFTYTSEPSAKECTIRFIPYSTWGNRGENEMCVYIRYV